MLTINNNEVVLSTGKTDLALSLEAGNINLSALKVKSSNLLADPQQNHSIWKITLITPGGSEIEIRSADCTGKVTNTKDDGVTAAVEFSWPLDPDDVKKGELRVTIRCSKDDPLSRWGLEIDLPEGHKTVRVDFPLIANVRGGDGIRLAAPVGWGLEYQDPENAPYGANYPSCTAAMQFFALYRQDKDGVYVGAHDATAMHKYLNVGRGDGDGTISCGITNWTALTDDKTYRLPYEAVVGVIDGGWMEAASIYRAWVERDAPWKCENVRDRLIPDWLKETDLWFRVYESHPKTIAAIEKAADFFDVNTTLHWYRWHRIPYDTLYPEYFPPRESWPDMVKAAQKLGFHVMPYINGRLWDPASDSWSDENAEESAARKQDGGCYTEVYGSKVPLNVMCPTTELWQSKVVGLVDGLINTYGVNGVYIDQIGAAYPERCFNECHDHPCGGGDFWVRGYRKLLDRVRSKLGPQNIITTEENAESWNDLFDALLIVNTWTRTDAPPIPLYPAVYSGTTIPFGFQYSLKDDLDKSWPFRMKMARCFLWGSQMGWYDVELIMDDAYILEAGFLRSLARARAKAHDFLLCGEFLGEVEVEGENPMVDCEAAGSFGGTYVIHLPEVMVTKWRSPDGRIALAVTNAGNEKRSVRVEGREITLAERSAIVIEY